MRRWRQYASANAKKERQRWCAIKGTGPLRDDGYLAWLRTLSCLRCYSGSFWLWMQGGGSLPVRRRGVSEAAHTGDHGLGQKAPDDAAIPLCSMCHTGSNHAYHKVGAKRFWSDVGLDRSEVIAALRATYKEQQACQH